MAGGAVAGRVVMRVVMRRVGLGLVVAVFGGTLTEHLLAALGTPPDVLPIAIGYARTMMLAMPGLLVFILLTQLMRGVGDTVTPLMARYERRQKKRRRPAS